MRRAEDVLGRRNISPPTGIDRRPTDAIRSARIGRARLKQHPCTPHEGMSARMAHQREARVRLDELFRNLTIDNDSWFGSRPGWGGMGLACQSVFVNFPQAIVSDHSSICRVRSGMGYY